MYGWFLEFGVVMIATAILAGTYALFLSPWVARVAERINAIRLPSFFRDAQPLATPTSAPDLQGSDPGHGFPHGH